MALRASYSPLMSFDAAAFGRRLASARAWRGLEPKQVAHHLDVTPETVNRWERGGLEKPPAKGQLLLLAEILQQPESWLLDGEQPPWLTSPAAGDGASRFDLPEVERLAAEAQERIARLLQALQQESEPAPARRGRGGR